MKKFLVAVVLAALMFSQTSFADFSDVDVSHGFYESIDWLQRNGVVEGYEDGSFRPQNAVNRAEFLKMLYEAEGEFVDEKGDLSVILPFPDVPGNEWYTDYVELAYAANVIDGYPDGTFQPANPINVVEAFKIVDNMFFDVDAVYDPLEYTACYDDIDLNDIGDNDQWYWKYLVLADDLCLIPKEMMVDENGNLKMEPWHDLSRGQMAELIFRAKAVRDNFNGGYEEYREPLVPIHLMDENEFGASYAAPGISVVDMAMVSVGSAVHESYDYVDYSDQDIMVKFDGELIVSGDYIHYDDSDPIVGELVCIFVDAESSDKLPRGVLDDRETWFCLDNVEEANPEFYPIGSAGTATIKIEDFIYRFSDGAMVFNTASLVQVFNVTID
ncbi:S-layer homology domain-containing protein [Patescibacteria group bacterium]